MTNIDFPTLRNAFELEQRETFERFRAALCRRVLDWLNSDIEKLRRVLYRIDVSEHYARQAFDAEEANLIAERLTDLLIDREMQKLKTRNAGSTNDWLDV